MYKKIIYKEFEEMSEILKNFLINVNYMNSIEEAGILIANAFKNGKKVLSCGNGGSHCNAMHFCEELTGKYRKKRKGYPAIVISDPSHLSCVSNDFGYEEVFSRYISAIGKRGDVLLSISTSGNSANIIRSIEAANEKKMKVIFLTGKKNNKLSNKIDIEISVPHFNFSDRVQEIHIKIIHVIILIIEKEMLLK